VIHSLLVPVIGSCSIALLVHLRRLGYPSIPPKQVRLLLYQSYLPLRSTKRMPYRRTWIISPMLLFIEGRYKTYLTLRPSDLNSVFFVLTTTARLISPFLTFWILLAALEDARAIGRALLMTTPISSPTVANPVELSFVLTLKTLIHSATRPPELSMICASASVL
jgi:hypothetical protein